MYLVKDRKAFMDSSDSSQPSSENVKGAIAPYLEDKGIKLFSSIGKGNMSNTFYAKYVSTNENIVIKAIVINEEDVNPAGYITYDRVAKKEEAALRKLNQGGANVVKLIDKIEVPINYARVMDKIHHKNDRIVIFVFEKLYEFSRGRNKITHKMTYSKLVKKWCKKYGVEVVAAVLGSFLIKEVRILNTRYKMWHRDLKTDNIMLEMISDDIFKSNFKLIDFGCVHIDSFDEFSNPNDHLGLPGSIENGGGTYKYYQEFGSDGKFNFKDEYFAIGMILNDLYGFLTEYKEDAILRIKKSSKLSPEMKRALLSLTAHNAEDRDPDCALRIFENIIKKASSSEKEAKKSLVDSKAKSVEPTKKYTLEDAEKALIKRDVQKAIDILESDDIPRYLPKKRRLQGIAYFLNDENEKAIRCFENAEAGDNWCAYMKAIHITDKKEKNSLFERLFVRCKEDPILFSLVCYHIKENSYEGFETLKKEVDEEAIKVNPLKSDFNALLKIAVTAA